MNVDNRGTTPVGTKVRVRGGEGDAYDGIVVGHGCIQEPNGNTRWTVNLVRPDSITVHDGLTQCVVDQYLEVIA